MVPLLKSWLERRGQVTRPSALSAVVNIELMQGISRAAERVACILETDLELARKSQDEDSAIGRHVVDALEAVACMAPRECDLAIPNFAVDAVATKIRELFARDVHICVGATKTHRVVRVAATPVEPCCSGSGPKEG